MTTTIIAPEQAKAVRDLLKGSDVSVIATLRSEPGSEPTETTVRIVKRRYTKGAMGNDIEFMDELTIPALGRVHGYGVSLRGLTTYTVTASDGCIGTEAISVAPMLRNVLRAGDELLVTFRLGNDTETLRKAGLSCDECFLTIVRKDKAVATGLIRHLVAPVTSTARMAWMGA